MQNHPFVLWLLRIVPALILLQTLYFKFTASPESMYIFSMLGMEPYGRIGMGVAELISSVLLLIPRTTWIGALLSFGIIGGAIFSHLFVLGIEIMDDGGYLFILGLIVFVCTSILIWLNRQKVPLLNKLVK